MRGYHGLQLASLQEIMLPSYQKVSIISVDLLEKLSWRQMPNVKTGQEEIFGMVQTCIFSHTRYPSVSSDSSNSYIHLKTLYNWKFWIRHVIIHFQNTLFHSYVPHEITKKSRKPFCIWERHNTQASWYRQNPCTGKIIYAYKVHSF